jgi:hypothetical protein
MQAGSYNETSYLQRMNQTLQEVSGRINEGWPLSRLHITNTSGYDILR